MNTIHIVLLNFCNVHFSNIPTIFSHVCLGLPNGRLFTLGLRTLNPYKFLFSLNACHMTSLSHVTSLHHPNNRNPACSRNHEISHHAIFSTLLLTAPPALSRPDILINTQFSKTLLSFVLRIITKFHTRTQKHTKAQLFAHYYIPDFQHNNCHALLQEFCFQSSRLD